MSDPKTYVVTWVTIADGGAIVQAGSKTEAIRKARMGEYENADAWSETRKRQSFHADLADDEPTQPDKGYTR